MVRLMLRIVSVSCVLLLSFAVLGLGVASSAVEAMVVMSEAGVRAQGTAGWRSRDRLVGLDCQKD